MRTIPLLTQHARFHVDPKVGMWLEFGRRREKLTSADFIRAQGICPRYGKVRDRGWIKVHAASDAFPAVAATATAWAAGSPRLLPWLAAGLLAGPAGMVMSWVANGVLPHMLQNRGLGLARAGKILRGFQVAAYVATAAAVFAVVAPWEKSKPIKAVSTLVLDQR